jgi:DNA-binding NtrC family response regulator
VRELKNVIERLFILQSGTTWTAKPWINCILEKGMTVSPESSIKSRKEKLEMNEIIEALHKCDGKQKAAAKLLGISESTLTRRIVAYNLEIYTRKGR